MQLHEPVQTKRRVFEGLKKLARAPVPELKTAALELFASEATCICAHPINQMRGLDETIERLLSPMKRALPDLERRDDILMSGHYKNYDWVSATGYYYGTFEQEWLGLPATHNWLYVRFGEFYKLDNGRIIESYILLDLVDVLRQLRINPLPTARGVETLCAGPATHDGLLLSLQDPAESRKSLKLVEDMIFEGLHAYDRVDHASIGMERYWIPDMMWFGPAGIGTTRGLKGFLELHQHPWQETFNGKGGDHKARLADGAYVASTGWPSIRATHAGGRLFGLTATNKPVTIRVMDWWRRDDDWLVENWIFVDIPHLLLQLEVDVFAKARALSAAQH